ncbi:MAG: CDP-diacylglycerol--glycerol-3-phosphate 3-phosphatidyltransferase [Bacilli bacterium]|nr:CDP-diacylglycerol--glycerol-3-phosphate 3-phosphatidyltransferase [Bacilli bacterium]
MNLPTKITFARIVAIVLMIITLFVLSVIPGWKAIELGNTGINLVFLILFVFFVLACYTDHLDGYLARKNNQVTDLGKFLDPVADKLLINSLVIFLIAPSIFAPYTTNQIGFNMWCAMLLVARDIVVDALRFIAASRGKVIAANIFGKLKTVLEMVAIGAVLLNGFPFRYFDSSWPQGLHIVDFIVYLATLASVISGVIYVVQNKHVFKEEK